ncbi:hypothetical protein [Neobacillus jeddahensis]|uniref:hypothetical protein n=1 Tax=Neobacillus jeddahensis TaxID=1461580 RepID=UPI00058BE124|nr:hypothetical protein [Neobacillus jeddahensis]
MVDRNKAREDLEEIINKREYTVYYDQPSGIIQTWWVNAKEWIATHLEKWFPAVESAKGASEAILIVLMVIVVMLFILAAFFIIRNMKRNRLLRKPKPLQTRQERNWTYQRHLEEAYRMESSGEYSLSTRHLFIALLLSFHERGWLEMKIWKTNWDYYDELGRVNQQCAKQFFDLASFFDEVTYGETVVQREEYLQFRSGVVKWLEEPGRFLERRGQRGGKS